MSGRVVNQKRVRILKGGGRKTGPVIYWMSRDQRVHATLALLFAQEIAVRPKVSLAVIFCGVAWCFGTHDRPWRERAIFGKIRYMNAGGLRRKFDAEGYVKKIKKLNQGLGWNVLIGHIPASLSAKTSLPRLEQFPVVSFTGV